MTAPALHARPVLILSWDHRLVREVRAQSYGISRVYLPASADETLELVVHPTAPRPRLVIIDQGRNGIALAGRLATQSRYRPVPLLLLLDEPTKEEVRAGRAAGADVVLAKPVDRAELRTALVRLLGHEPSGIRPVIRPDADDAQ